jgi:hypothetical protein
MGKVEVRLTGMDDNEVWGLKCKMALETDMTGQQR